MDPWALASLWLQQSWSMTVDMAPWLLGGLAISGLLYAFVPPGWIKKHLAKEGMGSVVKAALAGMPLPLCSCGVIPVARHLRKQGAGKGASISFLVSTPVTGVDSIFVTYAMLGPVIAFIRPVVSVVAGILAGTWVTALDAGKQELISKTDSSIPAQLREYRPASFGAKLLLAWNYAWNDLAADIAKWLVIGILIGGAISALVPVELLGNSQNSRLLVYAGVMLLGIPLYVCAMGSVPIAAALIMKGVSPGAALAFLIVGPATNMATISFVSGTFGSRVQWVYLTVIGVMGLGSGLLLDWFIPGLSIPMNSAHNHESSSWVEIISGVILLFVLVPHVMPNFKKWFRSTAKLDTAMPTSDSNPQVTFHIPAISCNNCVNHVQKTLKGFAGITNIQVDLATKQVNLEGHFDVASAKRALAAEGYPVE